MPASETMPKEVEKLAAKPPAAPAAKSVKKAAPPKRVAAKTPAKKAVSKAKKKPSSATYRVQMSSVRSQPAVKKNWATLGRRHGDLLGGLCLRSEPATTNGGRWT